MPTDIFPEIDIPVVSVVWTYNGMSAPEIQDRIVTFHERQLAALVDDISRIEANSYDGVGRHQGLPARGRRREPRHLAAREQRWWCSNTCRAISRRRSSSATGRPTSPSSRLSMSSNSLSDTALNDLGQNIIRPDLAVVRGASVPYPYGGKPRVIMVDLDPEALQARG